ncbi:cytochrome b-c1 complex subunit 7-like [Colletes gigas]|uniref:cytochrome b-c1 complex subunit 7-like n=1 Tax=Colletes gigas TaxID=935657 RepID=UPI001C9A363E|nr:cytochrome b-c1 complex subunit 7-like [Colletes gigas]
MALLRRLISREMQEMAYNLSGFNKYGLFRDDLLHETPVVIEALRRLPEHLVDERNFRLIRSMQLCCQKVVLPREQWTKLDEDIMYLQPYIQEVLREKEEQERWNAE